MALSPFVLAELGYLLITRVGREAEAALLNERSHVGRTVWNRSPRKTSRRRKPSSNITSATLAWPTPLTSCSPNATVLGTSSPSMSGASARSTARKDAHSACSRRIYSRPQGFSYTRGSGSPGPVSCGSTSRGATSSRGSRDPGSRSSPSCGALMLSTPSGSRDLKRPKEEV